MGIIDVFVLRSITPEEKKSNLSLLYCTQNII